MKKTTILKFGLLTFILLQSIVSYSQNLVSFLPKNDNQGKLNMFMLSEEQSLSRQFIALTGEPEKAITVAAPPVNPAIRYTQTPYLGTISQCPNGGPVLPVLFLCGNAETRLIDTGITDAVSVTWYKFNASCPAAANKDCANETANASCWSIIGIAPSYLVGDDGQFKVVIMDKTNTPYTYYFNATKTPSNNATFTKSDIITYSSGANLCSINGRITVGGFMSNYEYCFTQEPTSENGVWQDSNLFKTDIGGTYNIFVRLKGVPGSCIFNIGSQKLVKNIKTDLAFTFSPFNPKCYGEGGDFVAEILGTDNPNIPFVYEIYRVDNESNVSTLVETSGLIYEAKYISGLYESTNGTTGGNETYECKVTTPYSDCFKFTNRNDITFQPKLDVLLTITESLTPCSSNGVIKITATGGTGSGYKYTVTSSDGGTFTVLDNIIKVFTPGKYNVEVKDRFGCSGKALITIPAPLKPEYTIEKTPNSCYGNNVATIKINITNTNDYTISYSIDNGVTFQPGNTFSYLPTGTYSVVIKYSKNTTFCTLVDTVTIDGPTSSLSATAKITSLPGCGPAGNELQGVVTITNAQGGVPFPAPDLYRYSFDGGTTWITSNTANIAPGGPYVFYIKDAAGCIYPISAIYIPSKPLAPVDRKSVV